MQDFPLRKSLPSMNGNYMESNIVVLIVGEFVFQPLNWKNISLFIQERNLTSVKNVEKLLHKSLMSHIISTQSMVMVGSKRRNIYAKSVEKYL